MELLSVGQAYLLLIVNAIMYAIFSVGGGIAASLGDVLLGGDFLTKVSAQGTFGGFLGPNSYAAILSMAADAGIGLVLGWFYNRVKGTPGWVRKMTMAIIFASPLILADTSFDVLGAVTGLMNSIFAFFQQFPVLGVWAIRLSWLVLGLIGMVVALISVFGNMAVALYIEGILPDQNPQDNRRNDNPLMPHRSGVPTGQHGAPQAGGQHGAPQHGAQHGAVPTGQHGAPQAMPQPTTPPRGTVGQRPPMPADNPQTGRLPGPPTGLPRR